MDFEMMRKRMGFQVVCECLGSLFICSSWISDLIAITLSEFHWQFDAACTFQFRARPIMSQEKVDWSKQLVPTLKEELKKRGLAQTGNKAELIARIEQGQAA